MNYRGQSLIRRAARKSSVAFVPLYFNLLRNVFNGKRAAIANHYYKGITDRNEGGIVGHDGAAGRIRLVKLKSGTAQAAAASSPSSRSAFPYSAAAYPKEIIANG